MNRDQRNVSVTISDQKYDIDVHLRLLSKLPRAELKLIDPVTMSSISALRKSSLWCGYQLLPRSVSKLWS